jgi:HK97 family phage major capsid protein
VEGLVRRDLATVLALALDSKILTGVGGSEPLGIANTTGITTITFSGAATWADCVDMEYQVENGNVQITRGGYLLSPAAKGKFKSIEKSSGSGQWLWMDNEINGYPAKATAQVPATSRAVFGNWPDLLVGYWEGMDIVVDPYTLAAYNQIRIVVNQHADAALRYPGAFCVSTDSAAQ